MGEREVLNNEKRLLDCTLRDGGYVNSWRFGREHIRGIITHLAGAGAEFAELGFIDERAPDEPGRSLLPCTESFDRMLEGIDMKNTQALAMIDYGTCGAGRISGCSESLLDGIRVIFKKHLRRPAMDFCGELRAKGYKVFAQLVSVTSYDDDEMEDLIGLANDIRPYAISVVDTYGLLHQNNLSHYIDMLDEGLAAGIGIGYHGHNNFQMGYANCISVLARETDRDIHVDGSLCGMGKSAGNAPTELIAMYMDHKYGRDYDISELLEAAESHVMPFYEMPPWGYNMFYFLAALHGCHPDYVRYYTDKRRLSVGAISRILGSLDDSRRLSFDEDYAQHMYLEYRGTDTGEVKGGEKI